MAGLVRRVPKRLGLYIQVCDMCVDIKHVFFALHLHRNCCWEMILVILSEPLVPGELDGMSLHNVNNVAHIVNLVHDD